MADDPDENDTQSKINAEDRDLEAKRFDTSQQGRPDWQDGSSSPEGGRPIGEFAYQGEAAMGEALGGGPDGTGSTGAELPGGAESEFARTTGGQTGTFDPEAGAGITDSPSGVPAQGAGTVGTVGGSNADTDTSDGSAIRLGASSEYGAQHSPAEEEEEDRSR